MCDKLSPEGDSPDRWSRLTDKLEEAEQCNAQLTDVLEFTQLQVAQLTTELAAATKRAEEAEAKLAQSTNYVADDDTFPTCVWFANGRVVSVNAAGVLEIRFGKQLEACDE